MEVEYASSKMKKDFESQLRLKKNYGSYLPGLANRLSELRAAQHLGKITNQPPPCRHKLSGDWDGCWSVRVTKNHRLVLRPVGSFEEGDLSTITAIRIEALIDYH